nr:unnamed protein product [Callosobruchus analis]
MRISVYKEEYELLAYADLCNLARQIDESISDEERQNIQLSTVGQNQCIWSPKDLFIELIFPDGDFWIRNFGRAYDFHKKVVLPELLGKYFTKSKHLDQQWCLCQSDNDNRLMIQYENDCCNIQWFHLECVGLSDIPNELWYCESCSNQDSSSANA